jgi:hypothetical protein
MMKGFETPSSVTCVDDLATSQSIAIVRGVGNSQRNRRPQTPIDNGVPRPKSIASHVRGTADSATRKTRPNRRSEGTRENVPVYVR